MVGVEGEVVSVGDVWVSLAGVVVAAEVGGARAVGSLAGHVLQ